MLSSEFSRVLNSKQEFISTVYYDDTNKIIMSKHIYKSLNYYDGDSSELNKLNMQFRGNGYYPYGPDIYYNIDGTIKEKHYYNHGITKKITEYYDGKKRNRFFDKFGNEIK